MTSQKDPKVVHIFAKTDFIPDFIQRKQCSLMHFIAFDLAIRIRNRT